MRGRGYGKGGRAPGYLRLGAEASPGTRTQGFPQSPHIGAASPRCPAGMGQPGSPGPGLPSLSRPVLLPPAPLPPQRPPSGWSVTVSVVRRSRAASPSPASSPPWTSVSGQTGRWRRTTWTGGRRSTTLASRGATARAPGTAAWPPPSKSFSTSRTPKPNERIPVASRKNLRDVRLVHADIGSCRQHENPPGRGGPRAAAAATRVQGTGTGTRSVTGTWQPVAALGAPTLKAGLSGARGHPPAGATSLPGHTQPRRPAAVKESNPREWQELPPLRSRSTSAPPRGAAPAALTRQPSPPQRPQPPSSTGEPAVPLPTHRPSLPSGCRKGTAHQAGALGGFTIRQSPRLCVRGSGPFPGLDGSCAGALS